MGLTAVESSGRRGTPSSARSPARPKRGPAKTAPEGETIFHAFQAETLLEADVAVEDIQELGQFTAGHVVQKRNQRSVGAAIRLFEGFQASHDLVLDETLRKDRGGTLDGLLQAKVGGLCPGLGFIPAQEVPGRETVTVVAGDRLAGFAVLHQRSSALA